MTDPELERRLRRLSARQNHLEHRLQRIENSSVFRFLRWLGPKLASAGLPVSGLSRVGDAEAYQAWMQQTAYRPESDRPICLPTVSVVLDTARAEPARLEHALASLRAQTHEPRELVILREKEAPSFDKTHGDAILWTNSNVILEPDGLASFVAAFDSSAEAIYSDWDHIDAEGQRHSPRFTPEFSPELLLQTPYFGHCYLTKAGRDREMPWPAGRVRRIPRILWHSQEPATTPPTTAVQHPLSSARASIVICSRSPSRLSRCLKALRATLDPRHEIIVVAHDVNLDQTSTVKIVPYRGAFHFGEMNRCGVQESMGDALCFLNDDVIPSTPDWLERMLSQAARPDVGVVGALLLYPDGSIQHAGVVVDRWHPAHIGRFQKESALWPWLRMTREVSAVTGACMAMRRAVWDELGGFDARFPVNYNDIDLCLRAAARGYRILIETRAVLVHEEARTRVAIVRPEEAELFHEIWGEITDRPDRYFNPQLSTEDETIALS